MKKLILFLALIFMISCHTKKQISESVSVKQQTSAQVNKASQIQESNQTVDLSTVKTDSALMKSIEQIEHETEEFESRLITYDTNKPVDSLTRKPPVASEQITTNKKNKQKQLTENVSQNNSTVQQNNITVDWNRIIKEHIDSVIAANNKTVVDSNAIDKGSGWPWWIWLLVGSGLTVCSYLIWKLKLYKYFLKLIYPIK